MLPTFDYILNGLIVTKKFYNTVSQDRYSVTRVGEIQPLWQNFESLGQNFESLGQNFGQIFEGWLVFCKLLNLIWPTFILLWQFLFLQLAKYWRKYPAIWSRCQDNSQTVSLCLCLLFTVPRQWGKQRHRETDRQAGVDIGKVLIWCWLFLLMFHPPNRGTGSSAAVGSENNGERFPRKNEKRLSKSRV